jgi:PAS domain S-box-containing protein
VILNYLVAVLAVVLTVIGGLAFHRLSGFAPAASLFSCGIMFVAWFSGTGPGVLATALTILAFDYFFLPPVYSFALPSKDIPQLALFAIAALFVVSLCAAQRRTADALRRVRDDQRAAVQELQKVNATLRIENAERQLAEDRARRAEEALQATIDTIPALAARHRANGEIDFVNQTWRDYTGLAQGIWKDRGSVIVHPDDRARIALAWEAHLQAGKPFDTEQRLRRADGEYRWHHLRRVPLRDDVGNVIAWYGAGYDIEDRKRAEIALRDSEAQLAEAKRELQLTIDTIPAMVSTYWPDGTHSFVNQTWIDYVGLTLKEAVSDRGRMLFRADDPERALWRASLASGEPLATEAPIRGADGQYRWHTIRRVPLRDAKGNIVKWYSIGFNIEDRKRAENALQRSEAYLAEAQKLSMTGSFAWDTAGDGHFWSDETFQILAVDRDARPSLALMMQRVHPDDRALMEAELGQASQGKSNPDYVVRLALPDGSIKHLRVVAHRAVYESGKHEIVGALMDISAARKAEDELHAAQSALTHASRVATLGEISATIAHEVNQPLAAIVANGQACLRFLRRDQPDLDDVRGAVEWIVKDGNRAADVIRRVRGLMKNADTRKAPLDINETIQEVVSFLQRELTAQAVVLRLQLAPELPLVIADRIQIQQVIINLVMNGIEAMQMTARESRSLAIGAREGEAGEIVVSVTDCGGGVDDDAAGRVFDAFFSTKAGGLGMGLSICRSIIEVHGGRLWATGNSGQPGATFRFSLPANREGMPEIALAGLEHNREDSM